MAADVLNDAKEAVTADRQVAEDLAKTANDVDTITFKLFFLSLQTVILRNAELIEKLAGELAFRREIDSVGAPTEENGD